MPLIDQLVAAMHMLHLPHVERAVQLYSTISAPAGMSSEYLKHLQENSPAMADELDDVARQQLMMGLDAMYGVIQLLNHCAVNFPYGRVLSALSFVAEIPSARAAQETLLDKMVSEFAVNNSSDDEGNESVFQNRVQMIREMLQT